MPLAWVTCLNENGPNYLYFAKHCKLVKGLTDYLNRATQLLYSDRHKGIPAFERCFTCGVADCIGHIIPNCRTNVSKKDGKVGFHKQQIFRLQKEHTEEGYQKALDALSKGFPECAQYMDRLDHAKTFLYAILGSGYTTHSHQTSNIAEIVNSFLQ